MRTALRIAASLATLSLAAGILVLCSPLTRPPEIGRGLPSRFADADAEFQRRVIAAFPLPLPEAELVERLRHDGFSLRPEHNTATFETAWFPCTLIWRIGWDTEGGQVTELTATYGGVCL